LRDLLSIPVLYDFFQNFLGAKSARRRFCDQYVRAVPGNSVLDIACGTSAILEFLPTVDYWGFDENKDYVICAQKKYPHSHFFCSHIRQQTLMGLPKFDIVMGIGIIHHLDDNDAVALFQLAKEALKPQGRLVTIDPCYFSDQSRLARYLISKDRGNFVRTIKDYRRMAEIFFSDIITSLRQDLISIPYTHLIMECTKSKGDP